VYRRVYALLVANALLMGGLAVCAALYLGQRLADPESSFLGPSWLRLPLLLTGALMLDMLPRLVWQARLNPARFWPVVRERLRTHWTRDRITMVSLGIVSFYVVYVSYRNLKSFLPSLIEHKYDRELHLIDRALMFGHDPSDVLHALLGTSFTAWLLSYIYLWFIPLVPIVITAWLVWVRNHSYGYWFVTSQCIAWSLGTFSYYALPTLGPGFEYSSYYSDLADTPTQALMNALAADRHDVVIGGVEGAMQTVAGFASLHVAITLLVALMVHYQFRAAWARWVVWVNFVLTVIATVYFGWHYIADDVAGVMIGFVAFYLGGIATGQRFDRGSLRPQPSASTDRVAVESD
jgi:hypothetical protein